MNPLTQMKNIKITNFFMGKPKNITSSIKINENEKKFVFWNENSKSIKTQTVECNKEAVNFFQTLNLSSTTVKESQDTNNANHYDWTPKQKGSENQLINTEFDISMSIVEQFKLKKDNATFIPIPFKDPLDYQTEKNICLIKRNLPVGTMKLNHTYCCKTCQLLFTTLYSCQCHRILEHNDKILKQKFHRDLRKMKKACLMDKKYKFLKVGLNQLVKCSMCERQTLLEKNSPMQRNHDRLYHSTSTARLIIFHCKKCKRKFRSKILAKNHICSVIIKSRKQKKERNCCSSCDLTFADARSLRVHTRNVHVKELTEQEELKQQPLTMFIENDKLFKDYKNTSPNNKDTKKKFSTLETDSHEIFNDENNYLPMPIREQRKFPTKSRLIETIIL